MQTVFAEREQHLGKTMKKQFEETQEQLDKQMQAVFAEREQHLDKTMEKKFAEREAQLDKQMEAKIQRRLRDQQRLADTQFAAVSVRLNHSEAALAQAQTADSRLGARLSSCEANSTALVALQAESDARHRTRRLQEAEACEGAGLQNMVAACCTADDPGQKGGHRRVQTGCDTFPSTCSAACAPLFVDYYENCQGIIEALAADEKAGFEGLSGDCIEAPQARTEMISGARPALMFHVLVVDDGQVAAAQAAAEMGQPTLGPGTVLTPPVLLPGAPPPPPGQSPASSGGVAVQEFRRICTKANLATCAPKCLALTNGFLLSIEIDGRGTTMTVRTLLFRIHCGSSP
jgi:hypothetical protein